MTTRAYLGRLLARIDTSPTRPATPPFHGASMLSTAVQALQAIEGGSPEAERIAKDALDRIERIARMR